jgi:sec-independent protein translocase protein TatA
MHGTIARQGEHRMGRIGLPELMIILMIVIIIFGANRLPQLGRGIGSAIKNFKDGIKSDETADHKS